MLRKYRHEWGPAKGRVIEMDDLRAAPSVSSGSLTEVAGEEMEVLEVSEPSTPVVEEEDTTVVEDDVEVAEEPEKPEKVTPAPKSKPKNKPKRKK